MNIKNVVAAMFFLSALTVAGCYVEPANTEAEIHFNENGEQCGVCPNLFFNPIEVSCNQTETDHFVDAFACICEGSCASACDGMCFDNQTSEDLSDPCFLCMNTPRALGGCAEVWGTCAGK